MGLVPLRRSLVAMSYVLFIAILNVTLGAVAAVWVKHRLVTAPGVPAKRRSRKLKPIKLVPAHDLANNGGALPADPAAADTTPPATLITLPHDWAELLPAVSFPSVIEPAGWVLRRVAVDAIRQLTEASKLQQSLADASEEAPFAELTHLVKACQASIELRLKQIDEAIRDSGFQFGQLTPVAVRLESLGQSVGEEFEQLSLTLENAANSPDRRAEFLQDAYFTLTRQLHDLRDQAEEIAVAAIVADGRLDNLDASLFVDPQWGLPNRIALEKTLREWRELDSDQDRLASFVMFDVDQTRSYNEDFGLDRGERVLEEASKIYFDGIRHNRGFDRIFRTSGQRFLLFLGDTSPKNAAFASERIRQRLLQLTLSCQNRSFQIESSAVVTALQKNDTSETLIERLRLGIRKVKKTDSRNTVIIQDGKIKPTETKLYQLPGKAIEI